MSEVERVAILSNGTAQQKSDLLYRIHGTELSAAVSSAVERCLGDDSIVRMYVPYKYGPLRVLAADVLAGSRAYVGDLRPIVLRDAPAALSVDGIAQIQRRIGIRPGGDPRDEYENLYRRGALKLVDEVFDPAIYG